MRASDTQRLLNPSSVRCACSYKAALIGYVGVLVALVVAVTLFAVATNTRENKCGGIALPRTFLLERRGYSLRDNVDLFDLSDGAKGSKVGELYRKLLTRSKVFRLKNTNNEIVGTMAPTNSHLSTIALCGNGVGVYGVRRRDLQSGTCEACTTSWDVQLDVCRLLEDDEPEVVLSTGVHDSSSREVVMFSVPRSSQVAIELDPHGSGDNWVVNVRNTTALPSWMVAFLGLAIDIALESPAVRSSPEVDSSSFSSSSSAKSAPSRVSAPV